MARAELNWENAMTATHETLASPASLSNAATAIFAVLGLIDVALTGVIGSSDAPPLIVSLGSPHWGSSRCCPWCPRGGAAAGR
jgi:hypothetical protein